MLPADGFFEVKRSKIKVTRSTRSSMVVEHVMGRELHHGIMVGKPNLFSQPALTFTVTNQNQILYDEKEKMV